MKKKDSFKSAMIVYAVLITIALIWVAYIHTSGTKTIVFHEKGKTTSHGIDVFSQDGKHVGFGIHLEQREKK